MMWIVQHSGNGLWAGNGWTLCMELATKYKDPDKALVVADAFHLADCMYDHAKARRTSGDMKCSVRDAETGEPYKAPGLVPSRFIYARENWQEVRERKG